MLRRLPQAAAAACGSALATVTTGLAKARTSVKPLHPKGEVWDALLTRTGGADASPTGVDWLDQPGEERVVARLSAAIGLPVEQLDILGLALKLPEHGDADLLFATTGAGPLTRFALLPAFAAGTSGLTTLLPYPTPKGPVFLRAVKESDETYELSYALGRGGWVPFGTLALLGRSPAEPSFDPIRSPHPELGNYAWVERLRAPAYLKARQRGTGPRRSVD